MADGLPSAIGRYQIRRELGRGTMGVVYEAFDPVLGRSVALKTISLSLAVSEQDREAFERRFLNEARAAARLQHPAVVVVHDVGRDPATGTLFMALEHLHGRTLAEAVATGPMDWRAALGVTAQVARALHAAHAQGILHRDVKPANVMLLDSGAVKVMDFGIAKLPTSELTAAGEVFGTPGNMSPEQATAEPLDARSDLFSLGTVLYHLLTGQRAFRGDGLRETLALVLHKDPVPPSRLIPTLPPALDGVLARALAKDPARRYPDGATLAADLEDLLAGRPAAAETLEVEVVPPRRALPRPALLALALAVAAAGYGTWRALRPAATPVEVGGGQQPGPVAAGAARLLVDFEHPLREGLLEVWVDGDLVLDQDLSGRRKKIAGVLKLHAGGLEQLLELAPGRHDVRVRVRWDDHERDERAVASFRAGTTRRLKARIGRLRKDLSLEWD